MLALGFACGQSYFRKTKICREGLEAALVCPRVRRGSRSLSRLKVSDRDLGHMVSLKFNFSKTNELMVHSHASKYGCCCKEGTFSER